MQPCNFNCWNSMIQIWTVKENGYFNDKETLNSMSLIIQVFFVVKLSTLAVLTYLEKQNLPLTSHHPLGTETEGIVSMWYIAWCIGFWLCHINWCSPIESSFSWYGLHENHAVNCNSLCHIAANQNWATITMIAIANMFECIAVVFLVLKLVSYQINRSFS